ncbi:MAG TPA: hypothetical protein VGO40_20095 [Longimicrobium sp.]|jgi:hypothetical protein|nr:hypothetical protein [Longimicrobium sp.]
MNRNRVRRRLTEAGIDPTPAREPRTRKLASIADEALEAAGIPRDQLHRIAAEFRRVPRTSCAAAAMGAGFTAWTLSHSDHLLHHAIDRGADVAAFVHDNIDVLTAGWHDAAPAVAEFLVEFSLHLPEGTIHVGEQLFEHLLHHAGAVEHAVGAGAHGPDLGDALHAVSVGADATDLFEGVATLGLSIAVGMGAKKVVEMYYEPRIEERKARLRELEGVVGELARLKASLEGGLPVGLVAAQLEKVHPSHWGF